MANDAALMFHGSLAAGTVSSATVPTGGVSIDLGSNSVNRAILVERRVTAVTQAAASSLDTTFQDSLDGATFSAMPGATGALLGFARATTTMFSSTDAIAPRAPDRIIIRTDKRYVRILTTVSTATAAYTFSVVGKVIDGGWGFAAGAIDT